jgi:hypothetical protein
MVFKGKKYNRKFTAKHFIDCERSVEVESIVLKIKITEPDFHSIKRKLHEKEHKDFVHPEDALGWIQRCVVGNITKDKLDKQR